MILDRFKVTDQVAVVTGAGRGIGAGAALALAEAGADVVISARTGDELELVAKQIEAAGRRAHIVVADLSQEDAVRGLATAAREAFGRLDIVVNNVGGSMPGGYLDTSVKALERAFHFNVSTAHALTTSAVPIMLETGGGSVVTISSVVGRVPGRGYLAYGTAKAALAHYTKIAAADLSPRIRVNGIAVGSIATSALQMVMDNDAIRTQMEQATPLRRIGDVEDIAAAIVYLSSPAGAYVTGKILEVDGGLERPNLELPIPDVQ
jgi:7-alpha-hydroxysteroid dehydrogenase